jgi:hypothetical protein
MLAGMQDVTAKVPRALESDILRVLLYFDVFRFPLTPEEIFRFLPSNSITVSHVKRALDTPTLQSRLKSEKGYYSLTSSTESYADERLEKERRAARVLVMARFMARIIRTFPFVRAVFLSGELSKGIASKRTDIDFVVVTQEQRLWIARTLLILFKKLVLFNRKRFFCLNHIVSENHLRAEVRNLYSATEVATVQPLENDTLYARYMLANLWILEYFPNWEPDEHVRRSDRTRASMLQRCMELLLPDRIARPLDRWLMSQWQRIWQRRYAHLPEEERTRKFQCSEHLSTAYGEDYQRTVLDSFQHRLKGYQLIP